MFKVGDRVYWTDPGEDLGSGLGTISRVQNNPVDSDTVISIDLDSGAEAEVFPCELTPERRTAPRWRPLTEKPPENDIVWVQYIVNKTKQIDVGLAHHEYGTFYFVQPADEQQRHDNNTYDYFGKVIRWALVTPPEITGE